MVIAGGSIGLVYLLIGTIYLMNARRELDGRGDATSWRYLGATVLSIVWPGVTLYAIAELAVRTVGRRIRFAG
ncbi:MAG: hypothetical protein R3D02_13075 [Hyphomicrobiales bacterium]